MTSFAAAVYCRQVIVAATLTAVVVVLIAGLLACTAPRQTLERVHAVLVAEDPLPRQLT